MATTVRTARPTDYAALRALFSEENRIHAALEPEHVQVTQDVLTREELDAFTTDPAHLYGSVGWKEHWSARSCSRS